MESQILPNYTDSVEGSPRSKAGGVFLFMTGLCAPYYRRPLFFCASACSIISRILRWNRLSCLGFFLFSWILAWILSSSKI